MTQADIDRENAAIARKQLEQYKHCTCGDDLKPGETQCKACRKVYEGERRRRK